ncbi:MAG: portal protein [Solirubrobacteraceae bacterium]
MAFRTTSEPPTEGTPGELFQPSSAGNSTNAIPGALDEAIAPEGTGPGQPAEESSEPAVILAEGLTGQQWMEMSQRAFEASTTWFEASIQRPIARNYAHFQSRHAPGSKYLTEYYRLRSQTFRPKTRSMVRRSEAALAVALFSTAELLDTSAWDDTDPDQNDAAEVNKGILQYRMERTLYWYETIIGAQQEASVCGIVIGHMYWKYRTRPRRELQTNLETGKVDWVTSREVIEDEPIVDLVPIDMVRFDPAADWRDPLNKSPYLFHQMPMYVGEVKQMIRDLNSEYGGTWYFPQDDSVWWHHAQNTENPIRRARDGGQLDPLDIQRGVPDLEVVFITRAYVRVNSTDYTYDMLDKDVLLSIPRPVEEVFPHLPLGKRPLVSGVAQLEAHKVVPTSPVGMVDEIQREVNELANLTQDGIRLAVLNRWIARRGASLDLETLKYGAANSVIITDDVNGDVKELKHTDVPQSVFVHADRVSSDFDDLAGNFSGSTVVNNRNMNETVGGMELLQGDAGAVREYEIRTIVETFVNKVIEHLTWLEQTYETDEDVINAVCTRTGLNLERALDVLARHVRIQTNVGFGATSPEQRIKRIQLGVSTVTELNPEAGMQFDTGEIVKEVFGALGYKNGARFYKPGQNNMDPQMQKVMQENQQLKAQLAGKQAESQSRVQVATINAKGRLQHAAMEQQTRQAIAQIEADLRAKELALQQVDRQLDAQGVQIDQARLANERDALSNDIQNDRIKLMAELHKIQHGSPTGAAQQLEHTPTAAGAAGDPSRSGELARQRFGLIPFQAG